MLSLFLEIAVATGIASFVWVGGHPILAAIAWPCVIIFMNGAFMPRARSSSRPLEYTHVRSRTV